MKPLKSVYWASFLFAASAALAAFINSSFLGHIVGPGAVGLIYTLGAALTLVGFAFIPRLLKKFGNFRALLGVLAVNLAALLFFALGGTGKATLIFFAAYLIANSLVIFCLDIFVEHFSGRRTEGRARGAYLSIVNLAWVLMPALAGFLTGQANFGRAYLIAAAAVALCALVVAARLRGYHDVSYRRVSWRQAWVYLKTNRDVLRGTVINFLLQFFYIWMVIYTPIYLNQHVGLPWPTIGVIFTIMLLPFALIEYPLGKLSDKIGEKKFLIAGLVWLAATTALLFFIKTPAAWVWAVALFATRLGAATVEIMSDVYFFKHTKDSDPAIIGFYREMSPLAYLIAPALATVIFLFLPIQSLYLILGAIFFLVGLPLASIIKDTR